MKITKFYFKFFKMSDNLLFFDRAFGCFLGQSIGDALGTRYEFKTTRDTRTAIDEDTKNGFLPILGGGPFNMEVGQVTDDTEMAMALARSIQRLRKFDIADIARSYAHWFHSSPPDIGVTTAQAFKDVPRIGFSTMSKEDVYEKILDSSRRSNGQSLSNGCLMRISPLAIAGSKWPLDQLRKAAVLDCQLTHPNPVAQDSVAAYVTAIWHLINTGDRATAYDETLARVKTPEIRLLLQSNPEDYRIPIGNELIDGDQARMGYLGVALKWAFLALRSSGDQFEKTLVDVVARGGDTDTNGCIAGALLGSFTGAQKIPDAWKRTVLEAKPRRLNRYDWVKMENAEQLVKDLLDIPSPE